MNIIDPANCVVTLMSALASTVGGMNRNGLTYDTAADAENSAKGELVNHVCVQGQGIGSDDSMGGYDLAGKISVAQPKQNLD